MIPTLSRRRALQLLAAAGVVTACSAAAARPSPAATAPDDTVSDDTGPDDTVTDDTAPDDTAPDDTAPDDTATADTATADVASAGEDLVEIPTETGGPYPADGTNGVNVLAEDGVVRSDITSSFGDASGVADGVPLTITLDVLDAASGNPLTGAAVYLWHCDAAGNYSRSSQGVTGENYLRGVQEVGADGRVRFTTIVPGCYSGRWPHAHFEVYADLDAATDGRNAAKTSQLALPQAACEAVYADARYPQSSRNLAQISLRSDNVFGDDGGVHQIAATSGDAGTGYTASLTVGV